MKTIIKKISNFNFSSRNGNTVKYIVLHFTGNQNDKALGNANYFDSQNRNASAHYFVDNEDIVQVVEDYNASWNCGDGNGRYGITNQNSIGIEMCGTNGDISYNTEKNTIELVRYLMDKYNISIDNIVRHYDASRKTCPMPFSSNNWSRWYGFKKKINEEGDVEMKNPVNDFNERYYLYANPDVAEAVKEGVFESGESHFIHCGYNEGRKYKMDKPSNWSESGYLINNSDVAEAIDNGSFKTGFEHYSNFGFYEGRSYILESKDGQEHECKCVDKEKLIREISEIINKS